MLSSPVYTKAHPRRIALAATTGYPVCKLVTPKAPTDPTSTLYLFSFQSLADPYSPSCSNGTPSISFNFILLQTLSLTTDGYTPLILFSSTASSPICSIFRRPSHFSSTAYKMLLPQLLCFDNDPFSWGCIPPRLILTRRLSPPPLSRSHSDTGGSTQSRAPVFIPYVPRATACPPWRGSRARLRSSERPGELW
jgi:hypothetical protein